MPHWRIFLGVLFLCLAVTPGRLFQQDSWTMFRTAESLAGGLGLAIGPGDQTAEAPSGNWYSVYGFLQPTLAVPLLWIGGGVEDLLGPQLWAKVSPDTHGPEFFAAMLNAIVVALIAVQVFRLLGPQLRRPRLALAVALSCVFGTVLLTYSREFFVQPLHALLLLIALGAADELHHRVSVGSSAVLGASLALLLANRIDAVVLWAIFGGWFVWCVLRGPRDATRDAHLRSAVVFVAVCLIGLAVELWHNWIRSGDLLFLDRRPDRPFAFLPWQTLPDILFNPYRSLFLFGPSVLLLLTRPRSARPTVLSGLCWLVLASYGLFYTCFETWYGGVNVGPRFFVVLYPVAFVILGLRADEMWDCRDFRLAWWSLLALGCVFNLGETLLDYTRGQSLSGYIAEIFGVQGVDWDASWQGAKFVPAVWAIRCLQRGQWVMGLGHLMLCLGVGTACLVSALRTVPSERVKALGWCEVTQSSITSPS